jgi:alanyl-tRNA synthetase
MKRLSTNEIRQYWLDYFQDKGHAVVESSSLVPFGDPTLMFTNAGMVQFKDVFTGAERRPYSRAATAQKCLRVSGKHNDLENVGPSPRHHTFFEMLGNFSFGDYFKRDAIRFAWDLLVNEWGLPLERLWFSVYQDDDEAERLWIETGAPADRVLRFGKKDNWWAMGDTGPCGPCSEIHFYWGDLAKQTPAGVNKDDEYLEIWNLVFMQYDQKPTGELVPLPAPSVDTGAGLERVASILQGKDNNYDTDAFAPIMDRIQQLLEEDDEHRQENLARYRAIADHSRAISFLIADGILPGNEGRSYVLRMILRRAARFGTLLGFPGPFLAQIADVVIDEMGEHYTDLPKKREFILATITAEEERFQRTLSTGLALLDDLIARLQASGSTVIPGDEAFHLWDTYGFPIDLTNDVATEAGFTVDESGYRVALAEQKQKSRANALDKSMQDVSLYADLLRNLQSEGVVGPSGTVQRVYENLGELNTTVAAIIRSHASGNETISEAQVGEHVEIVLPESPFYVESGGQVSDTGEIYYFPEDVDQPVWTVEVTDMRRRVPGLVTHIGTVTSGTVRVGDPALAAIDTERRWDIQRNHTATHVLHAVLRQQLGTHAHQAGSLVEPSRLRFDFTHPQPIKEEELAEIERIANTIILDNYPVNTRWTSQKRAIEEGAMALFGEKYGEEVRVVSFGEDQGISMELCGGTHVESTAEIGGFRITSEGSVAAGVRRIEVVTGRTAEAITESRWHLVDEMADLLHAKPDEVKGATQQLLAQNQQLQKEIAQLRQKLAQQNSASLLEKAVQVNGVTVLATTLEAADVETLRQMSDWLRDKLGSAVVVVGAIIGDKPQLVAAVTPDLISRGMHAGNLLREAAKVIGGGGGGRPDMAQAGGKDASKLDAALATVPGWISANLK